MAHDCGDRASRQEPGSPPRLCHTLLSSLQLGEGQSTVALRLENKLRTVSPQANTEATLPHPDFTETESTKAPFLSLPQVPYHLPPPPRPHTQSFLCITS